MPTAMRGSGDAVAVEVGKARTIAHKCPVLTAHIALLDESAIARARSGIG
jgi:hypothetical protein